MNAHSHTPVLQSLFVNMFPCYVCSLFVPCYVFHVMCMCMFSIFVNILSKLLAYAHILQQQLIQVSEFDIS